MCFPCEPCWFWTVPYRTLNDVMPHGQSADHSWLIHEVNTPITTPIMHADPCACNTPLMFLAFLFHAFARRITRLCSTLVSDSCALLYDRLVYIDLLYHSMNPRTVLVYYQYSNLIYLSFYFELVLLVS